MIDEERERVTIGIAVESPEDYLHVDVVVGSEGNIYYEVAAKPSQDLGKREEQQAWLNSLGVEVALEPGPPLWEGGPVIKTSYVPDGYGGMRDVPYNKRMDEVGGRKLRDTLGALKPRTS